MTDRPPDIDTNRNRLVVDSFQAASKKLVRTRANRMNNSTFGFLVVDSFQSASQIDNPFNIHSNEGKSYEQT